MKTFQVFPPIKQEMKTISSYPIYFTNDIFSIHNALLKDVISKNTLQYPSKLLVVIDRAVARAHPTLISSIESYQKKYSHYLSLVGKPLVITGGERCKNDTRNIPRIHKAISELNICRHSYVVAIGGGALLDMVGYAAATAHRGIRLIRIPTTVLAQDDSSVGVKNGINAYGKKNFLGTFACPEAVLIDFQFLETLSERDWLSGIAEAIKVAVLKDSRFFAYIEKSAPLLLSRDITAMQKVVRGGATLHAEHISMGGDPFEEGSSRPLDFGHWSGHKLEQMSNFRLRHGEAVALGMALDTTYSYLMGICTKEDWQRTLNVLLSLNLPVFVDDMLNPELLRGLQEFREHLGGELTIMLLKNIGEGVEVHEMDESKITESAHLLKSYVHAK